MQKHKAILASILILSLFSQSAFAFLPLGADNIIIQNIQTTSTKQGTYNKTLANNTIINSGGIGWNLLNGSGNPIHAVNDPTRNQINITISSTGSAGVTSLNALNGALTIACVSGNTTCTTSGGNTITINTAYNVVTTGLASQEITKQLTLDNLVLGGNANGNNKHFTGINNLNATKVFQNGNQVIDSLSAGTAIGLSGSGNSRTVKNIGVVSVAVIGSGSTSANTGNITITTKTYQNNTGSNLGTSGTGVYSSMSGSVLQFLKMISANSNCSFSSNTTNVILTCSTGSANPAPKVVINSFNSSSFTFGGGPGISVLTASSVDTIKNIGVISLAGTSHNFTSSASTGNLTGNLGDGVVMTGLSAQTITKPLKVNSLNDSSSIVDANAGNKKVTFLNSGATASTTLTVRENQTTSQGLNIPNIVRTETFAIKPQINFTAQANRTGTANTGPGVMLGPGTRITPEVTGRIEINVSGYTTSSVAADGCSVQIRYGTGGDPLNGAAASGTKIGSDIVTTMAATTARTGFSNTVQVTGLAIGTPVWIQLSESAVTGGTCTVDNVNWAVMEI